MRKPNANGRLHETGTGGGGGGVVEGAFAKVAPLVGSTKDHQYTTVCFAWR